MSANLARVFTAIRARALTDTGTGGLFATSNNLITGIFAETGSQTLSYPYITMTMFDEEDDTFAKDGSVVNVQFHIFHDAKVSGVGPIEKCGAIIERLRGDGTQQSDRLPTFGFHRHKLTLSQSGGMLWGAGIMRRLRGTTAHENDVYHFIEEYEVRQSSATTEA